MRSAAAATLCAIVGLLTRLAMVSSVLTLCFLAALQYSWEPLWSNPWNGGLLAGLGFMFGRAGDVLSLDSLIARYVLRRPISIDRRVYWWPVILGQFGTAAVYFGGFFAKWSSIDFSFDFAWVFSDNLRNSVALPWLIWGMQIPPFPELIINNEWLWKLAAFGHLATQALPVLAMFSLGKSWVRLSEGLIYAAGVVLLGEVMGIWNLPWIILGAFFVDWEFFARKIGIPVPAGKDDAPVAHKWLMTALAVCFIGANLIIIVTRADEWGNRAYPFSSMNFYSNVAATKPYSEHHHYPFTHGELEFGYPDGSHRNWRCYPSINALYAVTFGNLPVEAKLAQQVGAMRGIVETSKLGKDANDCVGVVDLADATSIDLYASILDIPPYPERARFDVGARALVSRYEREGDRIIAGAQTQRLSYGDAHTHFRVGSQGFTDPKYEILLANDPWKNYHIGPLIKIPGVWTGDELEVEPDFLSKLPPSWYPIIVRVTEVQGRSYDFFGGILYH